MAWNEVSTMEQRIKFVLDVQRGELSVAALCRRYGISRTTGYKWIDRFEAEGLEGVRERSRRPKCSPNSTPERLIHMMIEERRLHPTWGPKKIRARLLMRGVARPPAASTIGTILKAQGMVRSRTRSRTQPAGPRGPLTEPEAPNEVWTVDFKGWFRTKDGVRCDPLTIKDLYSRYVLSVRALPNQTVEETRRAFTAVFKQYGLPQVIRSDNGSSFASTSAGRLSRFSVWLMQLQITPEFIAPGHPEQNGSHEQTHWILKNETTRPPASNRQAQQRRFNRWREEYNQLRPHEGLGMRTPQELYKPSWRPFTGLLLQPSYPDSFHVRRVRSSGQIKWQGKLRYISEPLIGQLVGVAPSNNGVHEVFFASRYLGDLHDAEAGGLRPGAPSTGLGIDLGENKV